MEDGTIDRWFGGFLAGHFRRCPHAMYPRPAASAKSDADRDRNEEHIEFFGVWKRALAGMQPPATEAEAREASEHLAARGGAFPGEQLPLLLARIGARRVEANREAEAAARREAADRHARRIAAAEASRAEWEALPEAERAAIVEEVLAEYPFMAGLHAWMRLVAIEKLQERKGVQA